MGRKRQGMTLIEMVICLTILAVCLLALVRSYSNLTLLSVREAEDDVMVTAVAQLIADLEAVPPREEAGTLQGPWRYQTHYDGAHYTLEVRHEMRGESYVFLVRDVS